MLTVAENDAADRGVQVTVMVQLPPAATCEPQLLVCAKSDGFVPARAMLVKTKAPVPVFLSVTADGALVFPTVTFPNATDEGTRETAGGPGFCRGLGYG